MTGYHDAVWQALEGEELVPPDFIDRAEFLQWNIEEGQTVLDLGCGAGAFIEVIVKEPATAIGVDVAQIALDRAAAANPGADLRLAPEDGPLPLEGASVDAVWCSEVLPFVRDTAGLLAEVRRVLRPGGRLLITVPVHSRRLGWRAAIRGWDAVAPAHGMSLRFFSSGALRDLVTEAGFEVVTVTRRPGGGLHLAARRD